MYYVLHNNCEKNMYTGTGSITSCTGCWCCWYEYYSRDPCSTPLWYSGIRVIILNLKEPIIYWLTCSINKGTLKSFAWTRMQEISIIFSVQIDYFHLYFFQWINFLDFASIKKKYCQNETLFNQERRPYHSIGYKGLRAPLWIGPCIFK